MRAALESLREHVAIALRGVGAPALVAAVLAVSPSASAQGEDRDEARAQFVAGSAAAESGRWADAIAHFSRSYELAGSPAALFNAGLAMRAAGRHVEARDAFQRLLAGYPDSELVDDARARLEEEGARIAVVALLGLDPSGTYAIYLDGRPVGGGERRFELDAGRHGLVVEAAGTQPFRWSGRLRDGQVVRLDVALEPVDPVVPGDREPAVASRDGGTRWAPWALGGLGATMLLVGGTTGVLALRWDDGLARDCPMGVCPPDVDLQGERSRARRLRTTTDALLFGGVAVSGVAAVLALVGGADDSDTEVRAACGPGGCALSARGAF